MEIYLITGNCKNYVSSFDFVKRFNYVKLEEQFNELFPIYFFDMRSEKDYLYHYNEFLHIQDFETFLRKAFGALMVMEFLNINLCL